MKQLKLLILFIVTHFLCINVDAQTTIIMKKEGGVWTVPCTVNGLKLKFIFDTGASDVSISLSEALFMLKNDYLREDDIVGTSYAQLANGQISENTEIILREIEFGGLKIYNVNASVMHELSAPLLLGQSALAKLGTFQFDPIKGSFTIINAKDNYLDFPSNYSSHSNPSIIEWNDCLTKYASAWGEDCQKCQFKKDTYKVQLKNTCTDALDVVLCVQEEDKTWRYSLFNGVPPKDFVIGYACKGTGKYLKFVRKAGNKEIILPTADQVNAQYKE